MTIREYIETKLATYGVELSREEVYILITDAGLQESSEYTADSALSAKKALVNVIPELLLRANVTEGGYSVSWNIDGIKAFYRLLCGETGMEDKLTYQPKVKDRSSLW